MFKWIFLWVAVCISGLAAPELVERHAARLRTVLHHADEAYHNSGEPIMDDAAYDALRGQYEQLLADYPDLPALMPVGAAVPKTESRVEHTRPVLSLRKAYSDAAVEDFLKECGREETFCVEPKIDGLTVVLRYRKGVLEQAISRGDGRLGMDVTAAIMASGCVPATLENAPELLEVRGEVFISFPAFDALNARRETAGLKPLKSPRNSAAGTLRMKDLAAVAQRGLELRIFEVIAADPMPSFHISALALARSCGLPAIDSRAVPGANVLQTIADLNRQRSEGTIPTDGIVIKLNDYAAFQRMGATARYPHGALARKYRAVPAETRLLRVEWMRGETGRLTPVAHFEPVDLDGATLQRASLHSLEHLRSLDLMIGDRIQVIRAGGAIPEIVGRSSAARSGKETPVPDPVEE